MLGIYIDYIFGASLIISGIYLALLFVSQIHALKIAKRPAFRPLPMPVSILKPLKGRDGQLSENLRSFFELDYPVYELIFGVDDDSDPAVPIVRSLQKEYPEIPSKLIIDRRRIGLNPKINNLNNMEESARYPYILVGDSNVRVTPDYLKDMAAHLQQENTGLVTSAIRGVEARTAGSVMENLHLNAFIAPNVFLIKKAAGIPISIGKSMLLSRETLASIGGFWRFRNVLAEDHLIGEAVQKSGLEVRTSPLVIDNVNHNWPLKSFMNRHVRWAKMRRHINEMHYVAEVISNPVAIAFVFALLRHNPASLMVLLSIMTVKTLFDVVMNMLIKSDLKWYHYFLVPLKDLLIGLIWYTPYLNNTVNWRGNRMKIRKNTELIPLTEGM